MKPERVVSDHLVRDLLHEMGYSLRFSRKTREGSEHPNRNTKFHYINQRYRQWSAPPIRDDHVHPTGRF
ncbi:ISAzo13-like element transposase-related protein [Acididesulfobacillus acetoxydans]|uniref:ISAzo13-like element transposase-related protein n=1 Tax=Acididesulfobacillus acetoxydans TaxID=1561005 RepID=UPI003558F4E6